MCVCVLLFAPTRNINPVHLTPVTIEIQGMNELINEGFMTMHKKMETTVSE